MMKGINLVRLPVNKIYSVPKSKIFTMTRIFTFKQPNDSGVVPIGRQPGYYTNQLALSYKPCFEKKLADNKQQICYRNCLICGTNRFSNTQWHHSEYAPIRPGGSTRYCNNCTPIFYEHVNINAKDIIFFADIQFKKESERFMLLKKFLSD